IVSLRITCLEREVSLYRPWTRTSGGPQPNTSERIVPLGDSHRCSKAHSAIHTQDNADRAPPLPELRNQPPPSKPATFVVANPYDTRSRALQDPPVSPFRQTATTKS